MEEEKIAVMEKPVIEKQKEKEEKQEVVTQEVVQNTTESQVQKEEKIEIDLSQRKKSFDSSDDEIFIESVTIKEKEETTEVQNQEEVKEEKQDKKENKNASLTLEELTKKYKYTTEKEELFTEALQNRDANKGSILSSKVQQIQKNRELQKSQQTEKIQQTEKVVEQKKEYQKEQIPERTKSAKHPSSIIIEKPNYYKSSKFSRKKNTEVTPESIAKSKQKFKQVVLALALCFCAIFCVTNCIVIDKAQSSISTEQDTYDINLATYFEKIATLDETNKAMDMFETYPEELNMPSQTAKKSNWFDRFCNWVSCIFGG